MYSSRLFLTVLEENNYRDSCDQVVMETEPNPAWMISILHLNRTNQIAQTFEHASKVLTQLETDLDKGGQS